MPYKSLAKARKCARESTARYRRAHPIRERRLRLAWRKKNRTKINLKQKQWRKRNKRTITMLARRYYKKNLKKNRARALRNIRLRRCKHPRKVLAQKRAFYQRHRKKILAYWKKRRQSPAYKKKKNAWRKVWEAKHPIKLRRTKQRWLAANKDKRRLTVLASFHKRRALIAKRGGSFTTAEWLALKARYGHRCLGCGRSEKQLRRMNRILIPDHVRPISKGGNGRIENIQPLCHGLKGHRGGACNNVKHAKHIDFRPHLGSASLHQRELQCSFRNRVTALRCLASTLRLRGVCRRRLPTLRCRLNASA